MTTFNAGKSAALTVNLSAPGLHHPRLKDEETLVSTGREACFLGNPRAALGSVDIDGAGI